MCEWLTASCCGVYRRKDLWLHVPAEEKKDVSYTISFSDADTGIWDGKGLRFAPGGKMKLNLSRETYNGGPGSGGSCAQFEGLGLQSAIIMDPTVPDLPPKCGHEINFFHRRSRSMIVALWALDAAAKEPTLRLSTVGIAPFRDGLPEAQSQREDKVRVCGKAGTALDMLGALEGWAGVRQVYTREVKPTGNVLVPPQDVRFDLDVYSKAAACHRFDDNLIFAGPDEIRAGVPFRLVFGCQPADDVYKQLAVAYDATGTLVDWTLDVFRPASARQA